MKRNAHGARCDQAKKTVVLQKMNDLLKHLGKENEQYDDRLETVIKGNLIKIERSPLCILYEMLLRYQREKTNETWFISTEEANETNPIDLIIDEKTMDWTTSTKTKLKKLKN